MFLWIYVEPVVGLHGIPSRTSARFFINIKHFPFPHLPLAISPFLVNWRWFCPWHKPTQPCLGWWQTDQVCHSNWNGWDGWRSCSRQMRTSLRKSSVMTGFAGLANTGKKKNKTPAVPLSALGSFILKKINWMYWYLTNIACAYVYKDSVFYMMYLYMMNIHVWTCMSMCQIGCTNKWHIKSTQEPYIQCICIRYLNLWYVAFKQRLFILYLWLIWFSYYCLIYCMIGVHYYICYYICPYMKKP